MKVRVITVGDLRQPYFLSTCREYIRRLGAYAAVDLTAVKAEPLRSGMSAAEEGQAVEVEGQRLLNQLTPGEYVFVLDEGGTQLSSEELAGHLEELMLVGRSNWVFLVGGPLGLSPHVKRRADLVLSLSRLTFPHELVPVILLEQLYRSFRIIRGEPYHR